VEADAYADSSFLVSLHRDDAHHTEARRFLAVKQFTLAFTPLHRLEVRNALRNAVAFRQLTEAGCRDLLRQIDDDLRHQLLLPIPFSWTQILQRCEGLSEEHSRRHPQRALDLLHVAIAIELKAAIFLSFDQRQRRLAAAAGLDVEP
jgi:predicted nucleic acid-binding protein